jgi:LEA14-like dessication related protein
MLINTFDDPTYLNANIKPKKYNSQLHSPHSPHFQKTRIYYRNHSSTTHSMLKKTISYALLLCTLILVSCRDLKDISLTNVDSFSIQKISLKEIEGELQLTIKNPNTVGFSIYKSEFDIIYGDVKLGKAKLHKRVHIGANAEKSYVFKLKSSPESLNLTDVMKLIGNASSGTIRVKGDLKAGKLFIKKRFPVDYVDRINLQK